MYVVANNLSDLDSIAATVALAHFRETTKSSKEGEHYEILQNNNYFVLPVLDYDFSLEMFDLRTEVTLVLNKFNLKPEYFIYL